MCMDFSLPVGTAVTSRKQNSLVPTCTVVVQHERDPCSPCFVPAAFCSAASVSGSDPIGDDFLPLNFL